MGLDTYPMEILEAILLLVDEQTLLLAQRVSQSWYRCIKQSPAIQRALFYQPAYPTCPNDLIPRQNPLLAAKFPYWFPADDLASCRMTFGAGDLQDFLDLNEACLRPSASWRQMLVQQPPAMSLSWVDRRVSGELLCLCRWDFPLEAYNGLRMNVLYDLVVQASDEARQYFYFRICRGFYDTYSNLMVNAVSSEPSPHGFYENRYAGPLEAAIMKSDIVLDTWTADWILFEFKPEFANDTWTRELVQGLRLPMGDLKLDSVYERRRLRETNNWSLEEPIGCGSAPLPDEEDWDL